MKGIVNKDDPWLLSRDGSDGGGPEYDLIVCVLLSKHGLWAVRRPADYRRVYIWNQMSLPRRPRDEKATVIVPLMCFPPVMQGLESSSQLLVDEAPAVPSV